MNDHPFVGQGETCQWCSKGKGGTHVAEPTEWADDGGNHAFITGIVSGALQIGTRRKEEQDMVITEVRPVMDINGDYTNIVRLTTRSGLQYDVTVTAVQ